MRGVIAEAESIGYERDLPRVPPFITMDIAKKSVSENLEQLREKVYL